MKILVTGSAGFIGFSLTKKLLAQEHDVVGIDNINDYYDPALKYARLRECGIAEKKCGMEPGSAKHTLSQLSFRKNGFGRQAGDDGAFCPREIRQGDQPGGAGRRAVFDHPS